MMQTSFQDYQGQRACENFVGRITVCRMVMTAIEFDQCRYVWTGRAWFSTQP